MTSEGQHLCTCGVSVLMDGLSGVNVLIVLLEQGLRKYHPGLVLYALHGSDSYAMWSHTSQASSCAGCVYDNGVTKSTLAPVGLGQDQCGRYLLIRDPRLRVRGKPLDVATTCRVATLSSDLCEDLS